MVSVHSNPCHYALTCDFVYPSYSIYLRGCYPRPHRWSLWFRSSCINGRWRPRPRNMRTFFSSQNSQWSGKANMIKWLMQHDRSCQSALSPTHRRKNLHERPICSPPSDYPFILFSPQSMHLFIVSCAFPSFRKSWDKISFRGGGVVVSRVTKFLSTFIKLIIML
jgi:hypothetical protein